MRWIVVDGIDGSGKSTVAHWMADRYKEEGFTVHLFVHPSEGLLGRISKAALQSKGSLMHAIATMFFIADVLVSIRRKREAEGSEGPRDIRPIPNGGGIPTRRSDGHRI